MWRLVPSWMFSVSTRMPISMDVRRVVRRYGERHEFADVDGCLEDHSIYRERDNIGAGIAGCAGVGDLVEEFEQNSAGLDYGLEL